MNFYFYTFIQGSCDTTQPMNNMDTSGVSNVDNPPLSSTEPFHFTASMEAYSTTPTANNDTSASKVDDSPSLKDSTTLGDVPPKLKSTSESHYTVKPMKAFNTEYTRDGKAAIDKTYSDDDDDDDNHDDDDDDDDDDDGVDDSQHDETSPFITTKQQRQPKLRQHLRSQHIMASEHSYNSIEDTQPLIEQEGDEDTAAPKTPSSWFSYLSVRSVINYLITFGSGIGNFLFYFISEMFRPHTVPSNTEPFNPRNNNIN